MIANLQAQTVATPARVSGVAPLDTPTTHLLATCTTPTGRPGQVVLGAAAGMVVVTTPGGERLRFRLSEVGDLITALKAAGNVAHQQVEVAGRG